MFQTSLILPYYSNKKLKIALLIAAFFISLSYFSFSSGIIRTRFNYLNINPYIFCDKQSYFPTKYITIPFYTITNGGGLGNQLFEVFTLLGMAKKLNRTAVYLSDDWEISDNIGFLFGTLPKLYNRLISVPIEMDQSTLYTFPRACCYYRFDSILECEQSKFLVIYGTYLQSFKYFENIIPEIRDVLKTDESSSQRVIDLVREKDRGKFKTCVHVRRGDFLSDGQHEGTNETFTTHAIDFLFRKQKNGMFFIFSNDPDWVSTHITNQLNAEINVEIMNTPADLAIEDLYFSQIWCDSFLITAPSSTFGWWLSYLSKNQKEVYYRDIFETNDQVKYQMVESEYYPREWKKIGMDKNWKISVVN